MSKEDEIKAYMEAKMTHIKMYNECMNLADGLDVEKFAELVRADEREACAKVCDDWPNGRDDMYSIGQAIRAREDDLKDAIKKGTKAWADLPDATEWVEELRGNVDKVDIGEMSLRDYFAASFVSSGHVFKSISAGNRPELVAEQAYMLADAMLKARMEKNT